MFLFWPVFLSVGEQREGECLGYLGVVLVKRWAAAPPYKRGHKRAIGAQIYKEKQPSQKAPSGI